MESHANRIDYQPRSFLCTLHGSARAYQRGDHIFVFEIRLVAMEVRPFVASSSVSSPILGQPNAHGAASNFLLAV